MDTVVVKTPPSTSDYADVQSGNKVSVSYYATGKSKGGKDFQRELVDVSLILSSKFGSLADSI